MLNEIWSDLRFRARAIFRRGQTERDLHDELAFHVDREADKLIAEGVAPREAARRARLAFGGLDRIKDDTRDARGTGAFERLVLDTRYALRGLRLRPGFTAGVVLTLALGVGANAAMFGVLDRLLVRAPTFLEDPSQVNRVYLDRTASGQFVVERKFEYATYRDLTQHSTLLASTAAFAYRIEAIGAGEDATELLVAAVSSSFFDFFDAPPAIGRYFLADEDREPLGTPVAVLAHSYWQTRYGAEHSVIGTSIRIGNESYRIIGVSPPRFEGVSDGRAPIAFVPITRYASLRDPRYANTYSWSWVDMLVRRKPGVSVQAASVDLTHAYRQSWLQLEADSQNYPKWGDSRPHATAAPLQLARGPMAGLESQVVRWIAGVAAIVLIIACANVANLLLVRGFRRRREIALRSALGADRSRIVQQLFVETTVLALIGGVIGLAVAQWGGSLLRRLLLDATTSRDVFGDGRTIAFAAATTLVAALLAGIAPAFHSAQVDLADALKAGSRDTAYQRSRARSVLLVVQGSLVVVLLVGAGLFVVSLRNVQNIRLGYDVDPIIYVRSSLRGMTLTPNERVALSDRLTSTALATPGVSAVTPIVSVPFQGGVSAALFVAGVDSVRRLGRFSLQIGSSRYFETTGTRLLRGRGIAPTDLETSPRIAVVSQSMANVLWPGRDAVGQCFRIRLETAPCTTVVGIAEDIRMMQLTGVAEFTYYIPATQFWMRDPRSAPEMLVRVNGNASDFSEAVRRTMQRVMPGASYVVAAPIEQVVDPASRSWKFGATMFAAFGLLALLVAAVGLYSVIAFNVAQRRHELGVRVALGANAGNVVRIVAREAALVTLTAVALGTVVAWIASRRIADLLYGVSEHNLGVYVAVGATVFVVALLASAVPASRAARVDPMVALRGH